MLRSADLSDQVGTISTGDATHPGIVAKARARSPAPQLLASCSLSARGVSGAKGVSSARARERPAKSGLYGAFRPSEQNTVR